MMNELRIDKFNLDGELVSQAEIFYKVAEKYIDAVDQRDRLYQNLKNVESELSLEVRTGYELDCKKVTEKVIETSVSTHPRRLEAQEDYLKAKKTCDDLAVMKEALQQKSYMLKELVQLYVAGYYSIESVKGDSKSGNEVRHKLGRERVKLSRTQETRVMGREMATLEADLIRKSRKAV
jgi:hypothetical protein